jgi:protein O-GlcNAc transferase
LIERDEIDILFDLSGHTAHHRLLTFARKPAPVQASWIGYAGTTGFSAIDYLLADRFQIPPESEQYYSEKVLRLPNAWVCFEPPLDAPELGPLPAATSGTITFGSFNFLAKVTPNVVEDWADILKRVPNSRLILLYRGFDAELARTRFRELFTTCGIEESRVQLLGTHAHTDVMRRYQEVDIALDPFPYSGGLTTCEALWMGVPVVTCPGETFASRHSLSLMSNIGITETIAANMDDYVRIAVELAGDLPRLTDLRHRLRGQMASSPLCDAAGFTRAFEALCRTMWRTWCESPATTSAMEPAIANQS